MCSTSAAIPYCSYPTFLGSWVRWSSNSFAASTLLATVTGADETYTNSGLGPGETWYYWLRSVNTGGNISGNTSEVHATTNP